MSDSLELNALIAIHKKIKKIDSIKSIMYGRV
jgi:hypothetical protein